MIKHQISLRGPKAKGSRISGFLLKDLLDILTESTKGAIRLRLEGRSAAPGSDPSWLGRAADFEVVGLQAGSTVIEIEAPSLAEAVPEKFAQQSLFPSIDTTESAFKAFEYSLADAISCKADSELFDESLLEKFSRLTDIFGEGLDSFVISNGSENSPMLSVDANLIENVKTLRRETPASQSTRIAGKVNTIRESDKMFEIVMGGGETVRGIAPAEYPSEKIAGFFGQNVIVSGKVVYRPSASVLRVEASKIEAFDGSSAIWSKLPNPGQCVSIRDMHRAQGPQSGLNKIWGRWPGDETDDQLREALKQ